MAVLLSGSTSYLASLILSRCDDTEIGLVVSDDLGDRDVYRLSSTPLAGPRRLSAIAKLLDRRDRLRRDIKALGCSGQLGHGIPEKSLGSAVVDGR